MIIYDSLKSFLIENLMINYSTLENNKKIDYKELIKMLLNLLNHLI